VINNIKAILERGWNPLNRMLLLHPELRKTMTVKDFWGRRKWIASKQDLSFFHTSVLNGT
jgi:hypothetical protein